MGGGHKTAKLLSYLLLQLHASRTLPVQLLAQLKHFPPQLLHLLLLQRVRRPDAFILLLCSLSLR